MKGVEHGLDFLRVHRPRQVKFSSQVKFSRLSQIILKIKKKIENTRLKIECHQVKGGILRNNRSYGVENVLARHTLYSRIRFDFATKCQKCLPIFFVDNSFPKCGDIPQLQVINGKQCL